MLNSIADKDYKQQFIGYLKRKELKMKQLKELEEKITSLNTEINETHIRLFELLKLASNKHVDSKI